MSESGITISPETVAVRTVREVVADKFPDSARIEELPDVATAVAKPSAPMVATLALDELQVTDAVRSRVVWSEYRPVALNCCVAPP